MITKYTEYIKEGSTLSKLFNNNFIKIFYDNYKTFFSHNIQINKIDDNIIDLIDKIKDPNYFFLIEDSQIIQILYKHGNRYFFDVYNKKHKAFGNFYSSIYFDEFKKKCKIDTDEINYTDYLNKYLCFGDNDKKNKYTSDQFLKDVENIFKDKYKDYFIKIYKKLIKQYKKEAYELLAKYGIYSEHTLSKNKYKLSKNDLKKYDYYVSDLKQLEKYEIDPFYNTFNIKDKIIKLNLKLGHNNYNYNDYRFDGYIEYSYIEKLCKELFLRVIKENNNTLFYKMQEIANSVLDKDISQYKQLKRFIFDEDILKKWQHLEDAENFDLI